MGSATSTGPAMRRRPANRCSCGRVLHLQQPDAGEVSLRFLQPQAAVAAFRVQAEAFIVTGG